MKGAPPAKGKFCLYGGVCSAVSNHANIGECVDALQRQ
jgi:hypothetical protein